MSVSTLDHTPAPTDAGQVVGAGEERRDLMMVGTFLAIAAGTMLIGALLGGWLAARAGAVSIPAGTSSSAKLHHTPPSATSSVAAPSAATSPNTGYERDAAP